MDIQADALWNPTLDAEELAREIGVVLQENDRKLDNPPAVASEKLYETAFRSHRMRRWRIGSAEGLRALTRDDIVAYYRKYYQPSNIILTLVGRFEREELLEQVIRVYGDAEDTTVERDSAPSEGPQESFRYNWQRGSHEQSHIAIGYHVPDARSDDRHTIEVLRSILTMGRASRMNRFLRDEQGIIISASASLSGFRDLGYFEIALETAASPVDAEIAALAEIEQVRQFGVTGEELARAKALLAQEFYHRLETVDGIADALSRHEALGDWKRMDGYLPGILSVTASDVSRVANAYLGNENLGLFEYLPRVGDPIVLRRGFSRECAPAGGSGSDRAVCGRTACYGRGAASGPGARSRPRAAGRPKFDPPGPRCVCSGGPSVAAGFVRDLLSRRASLRVRDECGHHRVDVAQCVAGHPPVQHLRHRTSP